MIALLAAVRAETELIRASLGECRQTAVNGIDVFHGELYGHAVCLAHSGIGKAAAAATAVTLLANFPAQALWLFGCGGAYPGSGLLIGDLALADREIFGDEGVATAGGFRDLATMGLAMREAPEPRHNSWPVDRALHDWAQPLLAEHVAGSARLRSGPFVTLSACTGTTAGAADMASRTGGICENMEGAAVALACQQLAVPLLEVRGISNLVEDRDRRRWDLAAGMTAAQHAILALLKAARPGLQP